MDGCLTYKAPRVCNTTTEVCVYCKNLHFSEGKQLQIYLLTMLTSHVKPVVNTLTVGLYMQFTVQTANQIHTRLQLDTDHFL